LNKRNNNVIPFSYKATFKICISSVTLDAGISTTDLITIVISESNIKILIMYFRKHLTNTFLLKND